MSKQYLRDTDVHQEYRRTTAKMDRSLGNENGQGPVTRTNYGGLMPLCFGGLSEGSEGVQCLIDTLVTVRLKKVDLQRSRPGADQELAIITRQLRRRISAARVKASFSLLL